MAQLRRVVRSNPISNFDQRGPQGGAAFAVLADAAQTLYSRMAPAAMEKMRISGEEEGRRVAQQQTGGAQPRISSKGGSGRFRDAIASIESAGSGDYSALGPVTPKGNRAYGRYQVMDFNVGPWTERHLGRRMTPEEFLADPAAQDAVFDGEFGSYVERFGNPQDAASMWFSGRPMSKAGNASDGFKTVPQYIAKFNAALGGSTVMSTKSPDATMVRTSDGKLEPRLYSPYSGEILQAHNIAAGIAYQAEMLNSGLVDLMSMSQEFPLNPEGFEQAAREYVDAVVENAPDAFKADLRGSLQKEAQRRFLGMVDEKHRDVRQRADNSSRALMDRWSTNYAEALASGNDDEAQSALAELQGVLRARESLPGAAWTPEQSANVVMDSQRAAQRLLDGQRREMASDVRSRLDTIIKAAKAGMSAADEALLADPMVRELAPEKWAEAAGFVTLRDQMPGFHQLTPVEQQAAIADLRTNPVDMGFQVDLLGAAEKAANDNARMWETDPIGHAATVLQDKPPQMPDPTTEGLDKFGEWMRAMVDYSDRKRGEGYFADPVFLSAEQNRAISAVLSASTDPETRAAFAMAIAAGAGDEASRVFSHLDTDPVLKQGAMLASFDGDYAVLLDALRGQELLATKQVSLPQNANSLADHNLDAAMVFLDMGIDGTGAEMRGVMDLAAALYAADPASAARDPSSSEAMTGYSAAINRALGQKSVNGRLYGGVQQVMGLNTLLPPTVSGDAANEALRRAAGDARPMPSLGGYSGFSTPATPVNAQAWSAASRSGTIPYMAGQPVTARDLSSGRVSLIPYSATEFRMVYNNPRGNSGVPLTDDNGMPYVFDIEKLIDATRQPITGIVPPMGAP
jgi:hypothetical protein